MPKPASLLLLFIPVCILICCNSKKQKDTGAGKLSVNVKTDTVALHASDMVNLAEFNRSFNQLNTQRFTAGHQNISVITAQKGLKVTVDPSVLEKENGGAVNDRINVEIIELTNTEELFKANAATVSNGKLLSSGGSYFIGMSCDGQKLRIKKGREMAVEFPVLKSTEMELFYGERDSLQNMNWKRAGVNLRQPKPEDMIAFTDSSRYDNPGFFPAFAYNKNGEAIIYPTLKKKIYYYEQMMTLEELIDTVNRNGLKLVVDTVQMWPKITSPLLAGQRVDTNFLLARYGPEKQFILKTYMDIAKEKEQKALAEQREEQRKKAMEDRQAQSLAGQIQKYYNPAGIQNLGWINCDRFYDYPQDTQVELNLPITFQSSGMQYFLLYPSFNGLMNGKLVANEEGSFVLNKLPAGEKLILIAFTKKEGRLYHCREEFIIRKNQPVKLDFAEISMAEMNAMFGRNVRI